MPKKIKTIKEYDIIEIAWGDAQSFDLEPAINYPKELKNLKGIICSVVGYFVGENEEGYIIAKEKWENGQVKYIHFIPKKSVIKIIKLTK